MHRLQPVEHRRVLLVKLKLLFTTGRLFHLILRLSQKRKDILYLWQKFRSGSQQLSKLKPGFFQRQKLPLRVNGLFLN